MRLRFATIEFFPRRRPGEQHARSKLVRITPRTGVDGRKVASKLVDRAGESVDTMADRAERAPDRDPQRQPTDAGGEDPRER